MKLSTLLLLIIFIYCPYSVEAQNGQKNFIDQNYIEVTGKSEMHITPDKIYISITLNERDNKNKTPIAELEQAMVQKLQGIGIDTSKDLLMKDIASNFRDYLWSRNSVLLSKQFQVIAHDGNTAMRVFIELEKVGISNVSIDKLESSKMFEYQKEVKLNAIKAAKEKAEFLALGISQDIGRAIFIQEVVSPVQYRSLSSNSAVHRGYSAEDTYEDLDIEFDKIKIEYSILCRFELK